MAFFLVEWVRTMSFGWRNCKASQRAVVRFLPLVPRQAFCQLDSFMLREGHCKDVILSKSESFVRGFDSLYNVGKGMTWSRDDAGLGASSGSEK